MKIFACIALTSVLMAGCNSGMRLIATTQPIPPKASHPAHDPLASLRQIRFHEARVKRDPGGALGWNMLAEAYLSQASERDDDASAVKAEAAARKSLSLRANRNAAAGITLSKALLAQHRFMDAQDVVTKSLALSPENEGLQRLQLEILLELGRYPEFREGVTLLNNRTDPASRVVLARWAGLTGKPDLEVRILTDALKSVDEIITIPAATVAWYQTQLGAALMRKGDHQLAKTQFDAAYRLNPASYQVCAWQTRLAAETGDFRKVIEWAEATGKLAKMTDIQGLAARAYQIAGDPERAEQILQEMKSANLPVGQSMESSAKHSHSASKGESRHTHDRLFAMALADLGVHLAYAHHAAEEDLEGRKDIYAYDAFAWTTFRYWKLVPASITGEGDGLLREAEQAMEKALSTGSKDPKLLYHAGKIFAKSNPARSKSLLAQAKSMSPYLESMIAGS